MAFVHVGCGASPSNVDHYESVSPNTKFSFFLLGKKKDKNTREVKGKGFSLCVLWGFDYY